MGHTVLEIKNKHAQDMNRFVLKMEALIIRTSVIKNNLLVSINNNFQSQCVRNVGPVLTLWNNQNDIVLLRTGRKAD